MEGKSSTFEVVHEGIIEPIADKKDEFPLTFHLSRDMDGHSVCEVWLIQLF